MIRVFCSVGSQGPFDRMVEFLEVLKKNRNDVEIFAQVGNSKKSWSFATAEKISIDEFNERFMAASIVVSHAGMGNIIRGVELGKPMIVVGRRASFGEHRNDHQLDTIKNFRGMPGMAFVENQHEFDLAFNRIISGDIKSEPFNKSLRYKLIDSIRNFVME